MSLIKPEDNKYTTLTLLSNGSYNLYNNNSLTSFSNKLHKAIILDPSVYHYVALQEIGISLNAENIPVPSDKLALIYISNTGYLPANTLEELTKHLFQHLMVRRKNSL